MLISASESRGARAVDVRVTDDELIVDLEDGRTIGVPLAWYPRLVHATKDERSQWRLLGRGVGIHWPAVDEDISTDGLLAGQRSNESQASLQRWMRTRGAVRPNKRMQPTARRVRRD